MASARRTYDTDSIYLRRIFARDSNNNKIQSSFVLTVDGNGEGQWLDSSQLVLSAGYYYLSTNIAALSNYVFTPMKYETNLVRFIPNVQMDKNLTVNGITQLNNTLNVVNTTALSKDLLVGGPASIGGLLTLSNATTTNLEYPYFQTLGASAVGSNNENGNLFIRSAAGLDFYTNTAFAAGNTDKKPFTMTATSNVSWVNLDIRGNLSFDTISTGAFSMTYFSSGQGAVTTLDVKSLGASTISTPFINADVISVNKLFAKEYNYDINQFNFKNLSVGTLYAGSISTGSIGANTISSGIVTADLISAGTVELKNFVVSSLYAKSISTGQLSLDYLSAGVIAAGTISTPSFEVGQIGVNALGVSTANVQLGNFSSLNASTTFIRNANALQVSTGYLAVPFVSTPYGEFSTISSGVFIGPLTQTASYIGNNAFFSSATVSSLTASNLSCPIGYISSATLDTGFARTMLASSLGAGFISAGNVSIGNAFIGKLVIGKLDITAGITNNIEASTIKVSSLTASTINIPVFIGPEARFSTIKAGIISSGLITGGLINTQNISVPQATIQRANISSAYIGYQSNTRFEAAGIYTDTLYARTISTPELYTDFFSTGTLAIGQFIIEELDTDYLSSTAANITNLSANTATLSNLIVQNPIASLSVNTLYAGTARIPGIITAGTLNVVNINTNNLTSSNLTTFCNDVDMRGGVINANFVQSRPSYFFSTATSNLYAENGFIKNFSFGNANFGNVTFTSGTFTNMYVGTGNANIYNINRISTGTIGGGTGNFQILTTSTINAGTFTTNTFAANVITASTFSTFAIQFNTLSASVAYIDTLSVGTEYVGQGTFSQATADLLIVNCNLGVATQTPVTNLDVNGSVNIGTKWRYFIGLGEPSLTGTSIKVSSDGFSWQNTVNAFGIRGRTAIWTGKFWVAGGEDPNAPIKYSGDGITWNDCIFPSGGQNILNKIVGISKVNGFYVAYGSGASNAYTSADGINWSFPAQNNVNEKNISRIVQDPQSGNIVVAIYAKDGAIGDYQSVYYVNSNAIQINNITLQAANVILSYERDAYDVIRSDNKWIVIGDNTAPGTNGSGFPSTIIASTDGTTWSGVVGDFSDTNFYGRCLGWNGQVYLAGAQYANGANSNTIKYSYDGLTWSNATGDLSPVTNGFTWNGAYWIASVSTIKGTSALYSKDGTVWSADGFTNTFSTIGYGVTFSGSSNYPVSTLINGPIEVLKGTVDTDFAVGSNLTYGLSLRNSSTVWQKTNSYISSIENFPFVKTDVSTSVVYLRRPVYYSDTFDNLLYATSTLTVSSLIGPNILSSGIWTSAFRVVESTMTRLSWTPVPGNPLWRVAGA